MGNRLPSVSGSFYPSDSKELNELLDLFFRQALPAVEEKPVAALVVPHAGYLFSGQVAASAFNQIPVGAMYDTVFLIGSSHRVSLNGASIYNSGNFITPLGKVEVDLNLANELIGQCSYFNGWPEAHQHEHTIEVQLPFLQHLLKEKLRIVPIVIATSDKDICEALTRALLPYFHPRNLFVFSTDFSHYPAYEDACTVDHDTADAILSGSPDRLISQLKKNSSMEIDNLQTSLCGWTSILTLLYLTSLCGNCHYRSVQYMNSGDSQYGDKFRVVGYHAMAVYREETERMEEWITDQTKKHLLEWARLNLKHAVFKDKLPDNSDWRNESVFNRKWGVFVSLYKFGELRGCIGCLHSSEPLWRSIQHMTSASALNDTRFMPVTQDEVKDISIELSLLTPLKKITSVNEITPGKHGIYIRKGTFTGTFLPQVALKTGWSVEELLGHCARDKAGIGWDGWRDAELFVYEAIVLRES